MKGVEYHNYIALVINQGKFTCYWINFKLIYTGFNKRFLSGDDVF